MDRSIIEDIDALGYTSIIRKGDGEPALVQRMKEIKRAGKHETIIENPPAYDPQSNGAAEKTVDLYMGQLRTLKIGLESRNKTLIGNKKCN